MKVAQNGNSLRVSVVMSASHILIFPSLSSALSSYRVHIDMSPD